MNSQKIKYRFISATSGVVPILCGIAIVLLHRLWADTSLVLLSSAILLAVGSASRKTAQIVIGCLLSGAGLGLLMYAGAWNIPADNQKGLFMLCIALGWFMVPVFTRLFAAKTYWLAFLPGLIALILASAILTTNDTLLSWIMQEFLLNRSLSALITAADLVLIGLVLMVPWLRIGSLGHLDFHIFRR